MRIIDALAKQPTLSFEFFPPREPSGVDAVVRAIQRLASFAPDFVSVTYGAGGSTRRLTVEIARRAQVEAGLNVMAHMTCAGQSRAEVHAVLERCRDSGIENIIALRGDPPAGAANFTPADDGFEHATDLISHAAANFDFGIAAAAYPEGHPESPDLNTDILYTRKKADCGAQFFITQMFYDNDHYNALLDRAEKAGIDVPIVPALMPILSTQQIRRITGMCGASIPAALDAALDRHADDKKAVRQIGIEHTAQQARQLLENGSPGIHFYVLNRSYSISRILKDIGFYRPARS